METATEVAKGTAVKAVEQDAAMSFAVSMEYIYPNKPF